MTTAKIVRAEATEAFNLDQSSSKPRYKDLTDIIPHHCSIHKHPVIDGVGICLCNMLCSSNDEVIMAAVLFLDSDPETEPFELDEEVMIVFVPESVVADLESFELVNETIETYADSGAAKVSLADLVSAYNKVHNTKFQL